MCKELQSGYPGDCGVVLKLLMEARRRMDSQLHHCLWSTLLVADELHLYEF